MRNLSRRLLQKSVNLFGYKITKYLSKSLVDPVMDNDARFMRIYSKCKPYTWTTKERMYALYKAVEYVVDAKIPGDFVECGVWKGGSTMLIAHTLLEKKATDRRIYLYDTFEGMTEPTKEDVSLFDRSETKSVWKKNQKADHNEWGYAPVDEVRENMASTKYPADKLVFVKGKVEDTIPEKVPKRIALLRLDTDWYESTKHELVHLYPLLVKNGVLIIDDYGHFAGAKKAVDEYFSGKSILLSRIDYTGRMGVKV